MKTVRWWLCLALIAATFSIPVSRAEETAQVLGDRVNVRGLPSLMGEVVTQLKQGETVSILEVIPVQKPKPGEPVKWFKVLMPINTPVWISTQFLEATNLTVNVPKLNVRAGPGENFSVIGRLERGDTVKEIRKVDNWMEIETPKGTYGYVASDLIGKPGDSIPATPLVEAVEVKAKSAEVVPTKTVETPPLPTTIMVNGPTMITLEEADTLKPAETSQAQIEPAKDSPPKMVPPPTVTLPAITPPATAQQTEVTTRRVVNREGIVRTTISIQAPTYYELVSDETRRTINYLHASTTNIVVKPYRGKRVVVSGEEYLDSRWPNMPVLDVQQIHLAP